jgi:hypothetical protein
VIKEKKLSRTLAASRELQETSNFYFIHSSGHDAACLQQGYHGSAGSDVTSLARYLNRSGSNPKTVPKILQSW